MQEKKLSKKIVGQDSESVFKFFLGPKFALILRLVKTPPILTLEKF